jgi:hypothetical protein
MAKQIWPSTQWETFYEGTVYNRGIFPSVCGSYGNQWVNSIIDFASRDKESHFDEIDFFFGCDIPSNIMGKHDYIVIPTFTHTLGNIIHGMIGSWFNGKHLQWGGCMNMLPSYFFGQDYVTPYP